jgi:hypothetical protein
VLHCIPLPAQKAAILENIREMLFLNSDFDATTQRLRELISSHNVQQ